MRSHVGHKHTILFGMNPKKFLESLKHITVAVIDETGRPWAVPVGVQRCHAGTIEWISKTDTVHSKAIAVHSEIALTAFQTKQAEGGEYGFYARANARKKLPLPGGLGVYEAKITEACYNDANHVKTNIDIESL